MHVMDRVAAERGTPSPTIVSLSAQTLSGVWDDMSRIAEVLHVCQQAQTATDFLQAPVDAIAGEAGKIG